MSHRWRNILLSLSAASLLFASCKKNQSTDTPFPVSYSPSIIVTNDNQMVYAINPSTGAKNWEFQLPYFPTIPASEFSPSPLLYNGMLYLASSYTDTIYKLNAKTGKLVKKLVVFPHGPFTMQATPIADGKLLYLATSNDSLYAVDTGSGAATWVFGTTAPLVSSPTIFSGCVFIANTDGHLYRIDKTTGVQVWSYWASGAKFVSSPSICSPNLYVGSISDSSMYCLHTLYGYPTWIYKTQGAIYSSPDVSTGKCIFGSTDFHVYCLDTSIAPNNPIPKYIPSPIWIDSTHSQIYSSPLVSNNKDVVYVGGFDYRLYALNIINGKQKWVYPSVGIIKSSPLSYNGTVYFGSYDKYLYAIDSATGTLKWKYNTNGQIRSSPVVNDFSGKQYNSQISGYTN